MLDHHRTTWDEYWNSWSSPLLLYYDWFYVIWNKSTSCLLAVRQQCLHARTECSDCWKAGTGGTEERQKDCLEIYRNYHEFVIRIFRLRIKTTQQKSVWGEGKSYFNILSARGIDKFWLKYGHRRPQANQRAFRLHPVVGSTFDHLNCKTS